MALNRLATAYRNLSGTASQLVLRAPVQMDKPMPPLDALKTYHEVNLVELTTVAMSHMVRRVNEEVNVLRQAEAALEQAEAAARVLASMGIDAKLFEYVTTNDVDKGIDYFWNVLVQVGFAEEMGMRTPQGDTYHALVQITSSQAALLTFIFHGDVEGAMGRRRTIYSLGNGQTLPLMFMTCGEAREWCEAREGGKKDARGFVVRNVTTFRLRCSLAATDPFSVASLVHFLNTGLAPPECTVRGQPLMGNCRDPDTNELLEHADGQVTAMLTCRPTMLPAGRIATRSFTPKSFQMGAGAAELVATTTRIVPCGNLRLLPWGDGTEFKQTMANVCRSCAVLEPPWHRADNLMCPVIRGDNMDDMGGGEEDANIDIRVLKKICLASIASDSLETIISPNGMTMPGPIVLKTELGGVMPNSGVFCREYKKTHRSNCGSASCSKIPCGVGNTQWFLFCKEAATERLAVAQVEAFMNAQGQA